MALVIVLAFVVLLSGIVIALLTRSISNNLVAGASSNIERADLYGQGAINQILGDLRQEIAAGSTATNIPAGSTNTFYFPTASGGRYPTAAPDLATPYSLSVLTNATVATSLLNIVKQSASTVPFYKQADGYTSDGAMRASPLSSTNVSFNGHFISLARWNKALLLPKADLTSTSAAPAATFIPPDWILTAADGTNPQALDETMKTAGTNPVVGRYAYVVYNEGGLLDMNAAGSPSMSGVNSTLTNVWNYKGTEAFVDLTELKDNSGNALLTRAQSDALVGWRNYASAQASGDFPSYSFGASATNYISAVVGNVGRFMTPLGTSLYNNQSDQLFSSRQQLLSLVSSIGDDATLQNALQYLGTFSRSLNRPDYVPPLHPTVVGVAYPGSGTSYSGGNDAFGQDSTYNPAFPSIRVTSSFIRNDGSTAAVGEPLVKKRFPLDRLAWITYNGPSATLAASDPVAVQRLNQGITAAYLLKGTTGLTGNIYKNFGLTWTAGAGAGGLGGYWTYSHGTAGKILTLDKVLAQSREPDFFELLKASINSGSIAKAWGEIGLNLPDSNAENRFVLTSDVDFDIIQIGANILNQAAPDNFPVTIVFNDGPYNRSFYGVTDLPYLYEVTSVGVLYAKATQNPAPSADGSPVPLPTTAPLFPGSAVMGDATLGEVVGLVVPAIWNPHAKSGVTLANAALAPVNLRACISLLSTSSPSVAMTNPASFTWAMYARYGETNNAPDGASGTYSQITPAQTPPWRVGNYDQPTGTIKMPADNALNNTAIMFTNGSPTSDLYREPTLLMNPKNLSAGLHIDNHNVMVFTGHMPAAGVPEYNLPTSNTSYIGFYVGSWPQRFSGLDPATSTQVPTPPPVVLTVDSMSTQTTDQYGVTISLEFQPPGLSTWVPYMQYNLNIALDPSKVSSTTASILSKWPPSTSTITFDPRGTRGGFQAEATTGAFLDSAQATIATARPNGGSGVNTHGVVLGGASQDNFLTRAAMAGQTDGLGYVYDADGVVRRAMGGAVVGYPSSGIGLPMATATGAGNTVNLSNRPIILHRMFRSVAELGHVFSGSPWRNLDFTTPESGFAPLLDVFCIGDDTRPDALEAGKVDLNGRQVPVFRAIMAGAYRDVLTPLTVSPIATSEALSYAQLLTARTASTAAGKGPFTNIADLVGRLKTPSSTAAPGTKGTALYDGYGADLPVTAGDNTSLVERFRESSTRALTGAGQVGTWNLLIDVIAQSGRYPESATQLGQFLVEGEHRYWVHVAIDRQTGKVIDQKIEIVNE